MNKNPRKRRARAVLQDRFGTGSLSGNTDELFNLALYENGGQISLFSNGDAILLDAEETSILSDTEENLFGEAVKHYWIGEDTAQTSSARIGVVYSNNGPNAYAVPGYEDDAYIGKFAISCSAALSSSSEDQIGLVIKGETPVTHVLNFYTSSAGVPDFTAPSMSFSGTFDETEILASGSLPLVCYFTGALAASDFARYDGFYIFWSGSVA